ncbi:MAG: AAA family ATPase [Planctomycetota bacterium]|jgi:MoxR-like ATPase
MSNGKATVVRFRPGIYDVGRDGNCALRFWKGAKGVSPRHAQFTVEKGRSTIRDLESDTGTMVNGRVIREEVLDDGDVVSIGQVTMRVSVPRAEPKAKDADVVLAAPTRREVVFSTEGLVKNLGLLSEATGRMEGEVARRIVGQRSVIRMVWATILARGHCLLVGVPGLAKTYMVNTFAEVLGLRSKRIQFTPDLMPSDIVGSNIIHEGADGKRYFEFVQGPVFTQLLLADEINRTPPKTQAALLEAMQERQVTVSSKSYTLPDPFCAIATQNPIEQEGTYPLPEAQLDRFMLCLHLDYPDDSEEVEVLLNTTRGVTPEVSPVMGLEDILRFQGVVNGISVSGHAAVYAARLVRATRPGRKDSTDWVSEIVDWGAGPRAGQSLLMIAKALAAMDGRPAICVDDVKEVAVPVMRHRISCNYRARAQGVDEEGVVTRILKEVAEP